ncbi:MAG TPA: hypothetical protein VFA34_11710 [Actinomycetota bacterium]|jgi:hypothetical protein|nr:hypothetical protein [Actinomycetota bacterium]
MRLRSKIAATATSVLLVALAPVARADSGSSADPDDAAGVLDVKSMSHSNNSESVTYRLEMYEPFAPSEVFSLLWEFDFNGDGVPAEGCIRFSRLGLTTNILRGSLSEECGPEVWATADARFVSGNAIEITLPLIDLVECCRLQSGTYGYRVTTLDFNGVEDVAPEGSLVSHGGISAPEPRRGADETVPTRAEGSRRSGGGVFERIGEFVDNVVGETVGDVVGAVAGGIGGAFIFATSGLCSGSSCFAIGLGAPVLAAILALFVIRAVQRRRRLLTPDQDEHSDLWKPRSQTGNSSFASSFPPSDTVQHVPDDTG